MTLSSLLQGVPVAKIFQTTFGRLVTTHEVEIRGIQYDSRKVQKGDLFVAIKGVHSDGHTFIDIAVSNGASAVVLQDDSAVPDSYFMHAGVVKVVVNDTRKALADISGNFFKHPAKKLTLIGVTGTNGKTTTTYLIRQLLESSHPSMRGKVGMIGTVEYVLGKERIPATHTTPESLELNALFRRMLENECTHVVMEVSSHSLEQHRVHGLEYATAVFTNLTQDHLDYHGTMDHYFAAKKLLFDNLPASGYAVTNGDDAWGLKIVRDSKGPVLTYGVTRDAAVRAKNISLSIDTTKFVVEHQREETAIESHLVGRFNVYNLLATCSVGISLGIPKPMIRKALSETISVPGRFERVVSPEGWTAIIDYAHTPDALEQCLGAIHDVLPKNRSQKIITVFGAGGDRDKTKRPIMGAAAEKFSDLIFVTSDNPRTEDPQTIIDNIVAGIKRKGGTQTDVDRRRAITKALSIARRGDVVLIAGKGHEDYQVVGTTRHHFNDREIVQQFIASHSR